MLKHKAVRNASHSVDSFTPESPHLITALKHKKAMIIKTEG